MPSERPTAPVTDEWHAPEPPRLASSARRRYGNRSFAYRTPDDRSHAGWRRLTRRVRVRVLAVIGLLAAAGFSPANATLYCELKPTPDGFVALREGPGASTRLILKMHLGDTTQIAEGRENGWTEVYHWSKSVYESQPSGRGYDDLGLATKGWVREDFLQSCG